MKKFICVLLLICLVFVACDNGNVNNNNTETISINNLSIKNAGIKSLYVSNIPVNNSGRAASGSTITTLSYINNLEQNAPFFFVSPSGKNIVLNVSEVQQLDDKRILVDFDSFYEITAEGNVFTIRETTYTSGRALIDMESGKVYDFTDYTNIQFVSNDLLFTIENQTLYKVDLNVMSAAVPLNNPTYNPITYTYPPILFGNKVLTITNVSPGTDNRFSIDINNEFPPKSVIDAILTPDLCSFINSSILLTFIKPYYTYNPNGIVIADLSGNPHFYSFEDFFIYQGTGTLPSIPGTKYFTCKLSIDDNGNIMLADYYEGEHTFGINWDRTDYISTNNSETKIFFMNSAGVGKINSFYITKSYSSILSSDFFKSQSIILYSSNGFIHLKKKVNGIQVESTALSMPKVDAYGSFINKDNYLYYLEDSSIKRLYLASSETPEVVYSNNHLLTSGTTIDYLTASGSNLIFYQYGDDNVSVNTYSLAMYQQGVTPKLLASSSIDVRNIIELDF